MSGRAPVFVIPATLEAVEEICAAVRGRIRERGLAEHIFPVELLLREGLNNAVLHGCNADPQLQVRCDVRIGHAWITIDIEDEGPGFRWQGLKDQVNDDLDCHGRGFAIYQLYAENVKFNRKGNRLTLRRSIRGVHQNAR